MVDSGRKSSGELGDGRSGGISKGRVRLKGFVGKNKLRGTEAEWAVWECGELEKEGVLEECREEDVCLISAVRLVAKRPGDENKRKWYRMVVRMMELNKGCVERRFKLPKLDELHGLDPEGNWYACSIDIQAAYHHVEMTERASR